MPLEQVNGVWLTPGGCRADNGRCFIGAAYDLKKSVAFIQFARGGWYQGQQLWSDVRDWFGIMEDPGCLFNNRARVGFRDAWTPVQNFDPRTWRYVDWLWTLESQEWQPTLTRPVDDWFNV